MYFPLNPASCIDNIFSKILENFISFIILECATASYNQIVSLDIWFHLARPCQVQIYPVTSLVWEIFIKHQGIIVRRAWNLSSICELQIVQSYHLELLHGFPSPGSAFLFSLSFSFSHFSHCSKARYRGWKILIKDNIHIQK